MREYTHTTGRNDPDHYERSPSTGAEEMTGILNARDGYDHELASGGVEHAGRSL